jgi:hypothetical protein
MRWIVSQNSASSHLVWNDMDSRFGGAQPYIW